MNGVITDIQRFSLNDGPGIRTTVFFKGCNLRCVWCHNPESLAPGGELMVFPDKCIGCGHCAAVCVAGARRIAASGLEFEPGKCVRCGRCAEVCFPGALKNPARQVSVGQVMREIIQDAAYYRDSGGGVTLSGGEVFCQAGFALELVEACAAAAVPVAVETNLDWEFERMEPVLRRLDLAMFDLKLLDPAAHRQFTGAGNARILDNARRLDSLGIPLIARTPLIPGMTATRENVSGIAEFLREFRNLRYYELLNFNPLGASKYRALGRPNPLEGGRPLEPAQLTELRTAAALALGREVRLG